MAAINDYYRKKNLMQQLADELEQLENDESLKEELSFKRELNDLLEAYGKSARDAFSVLTIIDPSLRDAPQDRFEKVPRAKRPLKTYKNPHTGDVVQTRGGNQKTLIAWREQYGAEAVQSWVD
jgi:hypothetical protein